MMRRISRSAFSKMGFDNIKELIESKEEEINPFQLLGIEPWVLRSLNFDELKGFLSDFRRTIAKYHHPDLYPKGDERDRRESYFKILTSNVDKLLKDDFYFRKSLDELREENILQKQHQKIVSQEGKISRAREELRNLEGKMKEKDSAFDSVGLLFSDLRKSESEVISFFESYPLNKGFNSNMKYGLFNDHNYIFNRRLGDLLSSNLGTLEMEKECRKLASNWMRENHFFSEEERPRGKKAKLSKKINPIHDAKIIGREYNGTFNGVIFGSLTYSAIKSYLNFHDKKLIQLSNNKLDSLGGKSRIGLEFSFARAPGDSSEILNDVMPFVSNFVYPYTFALVKEQRIRNRKNIDLYGLIMPISFSEVKY